jgi:hypothetical protein
VTFVELQTLKAQILRIEADLRDLLATLVPHTDGSFGPLNRENQNRLAAARSMRERIEGALSHLRPEPEERA